MIRTPTRDEGIPTIWGKFLRLHLDRDRLAELAAAQMTEGIAADATATGLRHAEVPSPEHNSPTEFIANRPICRR
jgi:hypothetical protein